MIRFFSDLATEEPMDDMDKYLQEIKSKERGQKTNADNASVIKPVYRVSEGLTAVKEISKKKWKERIDVAVRLNIDPRKQNQSLRGTISLPHGSGKEPIIGVFAVGEKAEAARAAGATIVGGEELVKEIMESKNFKVDRAYATPDMMPFVGRIARILGPKGLMPNPKLGTMTPDIGQAVASALKGTVTFRAESAGVVHVPIGNISFTEEKLKDNLRAVMVHLSNIKPDKIHQYFLGCHLSTTHGRGSVKVDARFIDPSNRLFMRDDIAIPPVVQKKKK